MPEMLGRKCTVSINGTIIGVARTKSLSINGSPVNITTDGDAGIQQLLAEAGETNVEVSVEGLADQVASGTLMTLALAVDKTAAVILNYGAGAYTITGDFFMTSYSEGMTYNDAITFSSSFASNGAIVKAPLA